MADLTEMQAKMECRELVESYTQAVNTGDAERFAGLFTEDGVWQRPHVDPLRGREAIRQFMLDRPRSRTIRHVTGGIEVVLQSQDEAIARSQTLEFTGPAAEYLPIPSTGLSKMVEYRDRIVRTSEGWRFAERVTTVVFTAPIG